MVNLANCKPKHCRHCDALHQNHSNPYCSLRCSIEYRLAPQPNGCIEWTGCVDPDGYGILRWKRRDYRVHRAIYALRHGEIEGAHLFVCHTCDNPRCCNDAHHFLGQAADNSSDARAKGRLVSGERQHRARLTETAVREIKGSTESFASLARRYGTDPSNIWWIKSGKGWKHV